MILRRPLAIRRRSRRVLEWVLAPLLFAASYLLKWYRPSFHQTSPLIYRVADRVGVYPMLDHYHEPLVSLARIDNDLLSRPRKLPGVDLRLDAQLALLSRLKYGEELLALGRPDADDELAPDYHNLAFGPGDAEVLYSLLRLLRPRRTIEVGGGHSTRFAGSALAVNRASGSPCRHLCIEPYESPWLERIGVEIVRRPVEAVDIAVFTELQAGDVLFIDSTHVVRPQGDVLFLIHEVLPLLANGVMIHIHDIFTPRDYPRAWLERRWFWTEQYVLEALLVDSPRYEICLALNHLFQSEPEALFAACPVLAKNRAKPPTSLWMRVRVDGLRGRRGG